MSWSKWNDWNSLTKAAKNLAENAQKRIDKVLDIDDNDSTAEKKLLHSISVDAASTGNGHLRTAAGHPSITDQQSAGFRDSGSAENYEHIPDANSQLETEPVKESNALRNITTILADSSNESVDNISEKLTDLFESADGARATQFETSESNTAYALGVSSDDRLPSSFAVQAMNGDANGWLAGDENLLDSSSEGSGNLMVILNDSNAHIDETPAQHLAQELGLPMATETAAASDSKVVEWLTDASPEPSDLSEAEPRDTPHSSAVANNDYMQTDADVEDVTVSDLIPVISSTNSSYDSIILPSQSEHCEDRMYVLPFDNDLRKHKPENSLADRESEVGSVNKDEKVLMASLVPSGEHSSESSLQTPVERILTNSDDAGDAIVLDRLTENDALADEKAVHSEDVCAKCHDLTERLHSTSNAYRTELASAMTSVADSQNTLAEITVRVVEVESKLDSIADENTQLVRAYQELEQAHFSRMSQQLNSDDSSKRQLHDQQQIVEQLRHEGTKLAEENFRLQQILKKIRSKNKEHEASDDTSKATIAEQQTQIETLQKQTGEARSEEKRLKAEISTLKGNLSKLEKQNGATAQELQDAKARNVSLQTALESAFKDIAALEFQHAEQNSKAQESLLANEKVQQAELRRQLDEARQSLSRERQDFAQQVEDSHRKHTRVERELQLGREQHQRELNEYQRRAEQTETLKEELQHGSAVAVQPYLRQIDQLQQELSSSTVAWTDYEQRLTNRLRAAQQDLNDARKREHELADRCAQLELRCADSDAANVKKFDAETSELRKQLNERARETEQLKRGANQTEISTAERDRKQRQTIETLERKVLELLQQQQPSNTAENAMVNQQQYAAPSLSGFPPQDSNNAAGLPLQAQLSTFSNVSDAAAMMNSAFGMNDYVHNNNGHGSHRQQSGPGSTVNTGTTPVPLSTSASVANWLLSSPDPSFIDGWSAGTTTDSGLGKAFNGPTPAVGAHAVSALPSGAVMHYKSEIDRLKANNDKLVHELANTSSLAVELNELASRYADLEQSCAVMRTQNETLMQMYGERAEQVNELKEDLSEAKVAYRQQLELLTQQLDEAKRKFVSS